MASANHANGTTPDKASHGLLDLDGGALARRIETLYKAVDEAALAKGSGIDSEWTGALVYGEVTTPVRLFEALALSRDDTFVDLGSGRGQVVMAAALHSQPPCSAVGVEIGPARHACAVAALGRCDDAAARERVRLTCGDALKTDMSTITKAFLCNAAFEPLLTGLFAAALSEARAPKLQRVATLAPLDESACQTAGLQVREVGVVAGTWCASGTPLYVYGRPGASAATGDAAHVQEVAGDRRLLDQVMEGRRESAVRALAAGDSTEGEMERGLLRTAMASFAVSTAMDR